MGFSQEEAAAELDMNELRRRILGEAPQELMSYSLGDSNVSFFMTGSWKGELQGNLGFFNSPLGTGFISPETPLLFKQEVDLTMSLWINNRWFVEANFLDDSSQNTYRAGYQGQPGEFIQYAGIGNTGLDFPSFPYLDLGGDSPSSFGFYGRFNSNNINVHTLIRYDAASREERIFTGGRERTYSDIQLTNSIRGVSFVLPDEEVNSEIIVYIEDENGTISDTNGRRWRLAAASEYAASSRQGLLELSIRPNGMVAIAYADGVPHWAASMDDFMTEAQAEFGSNVDLDQYPQCWQVNLQIDNRHVLVIYQPGTFSPFERRNRYDSPSSSSERAALVWLSTGTEVKSYTLVQLENTAFDIPILSASLNQRNVYELSRDSASDRRSPGNRWPLADMYPEIYLSGNANSSGDIALRFTNFNSVSGYFIGADAIPGSIQVWRSGILDNNFNYNSSSGEVIISGSVGQNETIRITYLSKSDGMRYGSIAAGVGAVYNNNDSPFSAQAAVGIRWNLTDDSFTEENMPSTGTVGVSAKAAWNYDNLKAHISGGFTVVQTDTTGLYRAAGMEWNEISLALPPDTSFISNPFFLSNNDELNLANRADLIYRNYYNNSILGNNLMQISWNAPVVSGILRPYPAKDSMFGSATVLVADFSLEDGEWTGFQTPLGLNNEILSTAGEIEIPFRFYDFTHSPGPGFRLIIQIGTLSGSDFSFAENHALVWEEELFPNDGTYNTEPYIARFIINEEDRRKLGNANYLRVVAVNNTGDVVSGRVLMAPPIVRGSSFRGITYDGSSVNRTTNQVTASETREIDGNNLESAYGSIIRRLHHTHGTQRVLRIDWEEMTSGISVGVDGRIAEIPLSDYRDLSFFVKGPQSESAITGGELVFIIALSSISAAQLEARIPLSAFSANEWRKVTIRYQGSNTGITVDNGDSTGSRLIYNPVNVSNDDTRRTSYVAILIDPEGSALPKGNIYIDEIILEDPVLYYRINAGAAIDYTRPGALFSVGGISVLEDFRFSTALESENRAAVETQDNIFNGSVFSRTRAEIKFLGINITGNFSFTAAEDTFLWSGDQEISKTIGAFSVKDYFYVSNQTNSFRHTLNMAYLSNFHARFDADALYDFSRLRQRWNFGIGYRPDNILIPSVSAGTEAIWTSENQTYENDNYGELWLGTFYSLVPDIGRNTDARRTHSQFTITQRTRPVGGVITVRGGTNYTGANNQIRSESSAFLDVPVFIDRTTLNFRAGRGFRKHLFDYYGNDVLSDSNKFFESVNDSFAVWSILPFYSLFSADLNSAMDKALGNSPSENISLYTSFNDHFSVRLNLPGIQNFSAFFIPSRITFRIERILEQKLETRTDMLNIGGSLGYSAINMFGLLGHYPVFKFYQSDEYYHGIEAAFVIPAYDEEMSWRVQSVFNAGFRGFSNSVLNISNTFTWRSNGYWMESFTAGMEAPTKRSILSVFYDWIVSSAEKQNTLNVSSFFNSGYEQLRRESVEVLFDKSGDYLRWSIIAGHEEIVRIIGRLNFTTFIKLRFSENLYTDVFTFDAQIGTTLRIIF